LLAGSTLNSLNKLRFPLGRPTIPSMSFSYYCMALGE
jgi:hypothetical protein